MAKSLVLGNGRDDGVTVGPMTEPGHRDRLLRLSQDAIDKGAKLLCGGRRPEQLAKNYFVESLQLPTLTIFGADVLVGFGDIGDL